MPPTLHGIRKKRDRAAEHLNLIKGCINFFINSNPYPVSIESHPEDGIYMARLNHPKSLPTDELAVMIGDCVHNMRSSLDYIVWELAGANIADIDSMFPLYDCRIEFQKHASRRIKRLPGDAQTLVERLQPYHAPGMSGLGAIQKIDVADKHKLLTVTVPIPETFTWIHPFPKRVVGKFNVEYGIKPGERLVHEANISILRIIPPCPDMQVQLEVSPQVEFGKMDGFPEHLFVVPNLEKMLGEVDSVIALFARFFVFVAFSTVMGQLGYKLT